MRAIASSAASIRNSSLPGLELATKLILEFCGGEPSEIVIAGRVAGMAAHRSNSRRKP